MLVLRPNEGFTQPDYAVVYKHSDGRELHAGRIFRNATARADGRSVWVWSVAFLQRKWREGPQQGQEETLKEARARFKSCWESSTEIHWPPSLRA